MRQIVIADGRPNSCKFQSLLGETGESQKIEMGKEYSANSQTEFSQPRAKFLDRETPSTEAQTKDSKVALFKFK